MEESGKENWRLAEDILLRAVLLSNLMTRWVVEKVRNEMYQVQVELGHATSMYAASMGQRRGRKA